MIAVGVLCLILAVVLAAIGYVLNNAKCACAAICLLVVAQALGAGVKL